MRLKRLSNVLLTLTIPLWPLRADVVSEACVVTSTVQHQPIGDESGKLVMTKEDVYRDCTRETKVQGPCLQWENVKEEFVNPNAPDVAQEYVEFSSEVAQVIAQIESTQLASKALFSGARGVCEIGLTYNFDWLEDPSFWASAIISAMGSGALGETLQGFTDGYAGCLVSGSIDMASEGVNQMMYEVEKCDPVDEFCDEQGESTADPGDVVSVTAAEWAEMSAADPDFINSVVIIDNNNGFVIFRYKSIDEIADISGMSDADAKAAQEAAKAQRLKMKAIVAGVQVTACLGGQYFNTGSGASGTGVLDGNVVDAVVQGSLGMLPFPYGSVAQAAWKLLNSFDDIDSCHNNDDAQGQGERHEMAYRGLKNEFQTCHQLYKECVFKNTLDGSCARNRYTYCCFESPLSMEMMIQMHAQLGHNWEHCTGITLNEFSHIKWRQCNTNEIASGPDGRDMVGKPDSYDMKTSFQFMNRCMDMRKIVEYIQTQIPGDFDNTKALDMIRDLDVSSLK